MAIKDQAVVKPERERNTVTEDFKAISGFNAYEIIVVHDALMRRLKDLKKSAPASPEKLMLLSSTHSALVKVRASVPDDMKKFLGLQAENEETA